MQISQHAVDPKTINELIKTDVSFDLHALHYTQESNEELVA